MLMGYGVWDRASSINDIPKFLQRSEHSFRGRSMFFARFGVVISHRQLASHNFTRSPTVSKPKNNKMVCRQLADTLMHQCFNDDDSAHQDTRVNKPLVTEPKRVHFGPISVHEDSRPQDPDSTLCWYSSKDFRRFQKDYQSDARRVARANKTTEGSQALVKKFHYYREELRYPPQISCMDESLRSFLCNAENRGVERFASRSLFRDKQSRLRVLYEVVGEIQQMPNASCEERARIMHVACSELSQTSVFLANLIAQ